MEIALVDTQPQKVVNTTYKFRISTNPSDPAWDAFVGNTSSGHHAQSSLWAQVKTSLGNRTAIRIIAYDKAQIVAGVQLIIQTLPLVGAIGYVIKGPIGPVNDPLLNKSLMDQLHQVAKTHDILCLLIQPPDDGWCWAEYLQCWGFVRNATQITPTATTVIDLSQHIDQICREMKKSKRRGIRRAERDGVQIREGSEADLEIFHAILVTASERQHYTPFPKEYFVDMWRILKPSDHMKLFLAEYDSEIVSAHIVVAFGNTVTAKQGGWSGRHSIHRPNELLDWVTLTWAKSQGYRYYDFEGIDSEAAEALARGHGLPQQHQQSPTSYKIEFGGEIRQFPPTYYYIYNPALRWLYRYIYEPLAGTSFVKHLLHRLRTR